MKCSRCGKEGVCFTMISDGVDNGYCKKCECEIRVEYGNKFIKNREETVSRITSLIKKEILMKEGVNNGYQ